MSNNMEAEEFVKTVKARMIDLRKLHGFTQRQIADAIHVNRSTYSYSESGKVDPSLYMLYQLACFYEVSPMFFFPNGKNPPTPVGRRFFLL